MRGLVLENLIVALVIRGLAGAPIGDSRSRPADPNKVFVNTLYGGTVLYTKRTKCLSTREIGCPISAFPRIGRARADSASKHNEKPSTTTSMGVTGSSPPNSWKSRAAGAMIGRSLLQPW